MLSNTDRTIRCIGCGIEVSGDVWIVDHVVYCCQDCSQGLKCHCGDRMEEDEHRSLGGAPDSLLS